MNKGIYILANDVVYDQLVALVNSIHVNAGKNYPVCVIPYDDRTQRVQSYIKQKDNIFLFDDISIIHKWEDFSARIWQNHPTAMTAWKERGVHGVGRLGMHRRFCCFDGPFQQYIYLDADTLVLGNLDLIFDQIESHDWVVYDFQHKDISHVFDINSRKLEEIFSPEQLEFIFCAGMYASRNSTFSDEQLNWLLSELKTDAEILYFNAPDQSIVNYMVLKLGLRVCNLSKHLTSDEVTGCCVTSSHFQKYENHLLDKGKRLTYLHYIGIPSIAFKRLCDGENIDFPYRDIFLHYRYLGDSESTPKFTGKPFSYKPKPKSLAQRVIRKLGLLTK